MGGSVTTKRKEDEQEKVDQKKRILVIDDDQDTTNSIRLSLEDSGLFEVDTYTDPLVALSNYRSNFYSILLIDIRMPKMDGFELYQKIKKIDNKVKVCFISEYDVDHTALKEKIPPLELDYFVSKYIIRKPIEINKLISAIESELLT